jgi:hypothetical protein
MREHMDLTYGFISDRWRRPGIGKEHIVGPSDVTSMKGFFPKVFELRGVFVPVEGNCGSKFLLKQFLQQAAWPGAVMCCIHKNVVKLIVRILGWIIDSGFDSELSYLRNCGAGSHNCAEIFGWQIP